MSLPAWRRNVAVQSNTVRLEWPGYGTHRKYKDFNADRPISATRQPWVAQITGLDAQYGFARHFIDGELDRRNESSTSNRGVVLRFHLRWYKIYDLRFFTSWSNEVRVICFSGEEGLDAINHDQARKWLSDQH